jgi:hypothetical protein
LAIEKGRRVNRRVSRRPASSEVDLGRYGCQLCLGERSVAGDRNSSVPCRLYRQLKGQKMVDRQCLRPYHIGLWAAAFVRGKRDLAAARRNTSNDRMPVRGIKQMNPIIAATEDINLLFGCWRRQTGCITSFGLCVCHQSSCPMNSGCDPSNGIYRAILAFGG